MISLSGTLLYAAAALAAVLVLIWLAARAARLSGLAPGGSGTRRLGVVETLALDTKRRLYLVRCDGRELLLLAGNGHDALIGWIGRTEAEP